MRSVSTFGSSGADSRSVDDLLRDSDDFFSRQGPVHRTLRRLAKRLDDEKIPYAVIGGMALYLSGYERLTTDVDLLMTPDGLRRFQERFLGLGFSAAFSGARRTFRDTETKVKVEVITTGEPDPTVASTDREGIRVIALEKLIELKIASGLSAPHRTHIDLADVQRLIEELHLPLELGDRLDASVRAEYHRLWDLAQHAREGPHERE
jgi:hypothetical protein